MIAMLLAAAAYACNDVPGADLLWAKPETRWIIVGEVHGTRETPAIFGDLVCQAARTMRPNAVALEYADSDQRAIDTFLTSNGSVEARRAFETSSWTAKYPDGRGSEAMAALFKRLRRLKQAGRIMGVTAFLSSTTMRDQTASNAAMADRLNAIALPNDGLILTLVGNGHAMKTNITRPGITIVPAAADLPLGRTISVDALGNGGMAWVCEQDGCGPHRSGLNRAAQRGVVLGDDGDYPPGTFDGVLNLGTRTQAAPPMANDVQ